MAPPSEHPGEDTEPAIRQLSSRVVYRNPWMTLREDQVERQDGSQGIYAVIDKPDFALIIPAENDGFHLVEQYRYPTGRRMWEFPQGTFPNGRTGSPTDLARAELEEETGIRAGQLRRLGFLHCAHSITGQGFHVFLATDLHHGTPRREVEEQDMVQAWIPREELERRIRDGVITDDSTLAAYTLLLLDGNPSTAPACTST
ncbi:MAG TPA: NUDIX hydrolase [Propionibacteriaceae bacterium]